MIDPIVSGPIPHRRFRRFAHALVSGYAQLFGNVLYILASVPLALHYLDRREFGLWALAAQLGGYLQLVDLGMSGSVSRHLIEYKDRRASADYGSTVQTGALVLITQGIIVLVGGGAILLFGAPLLHIDPALERSFKILMLGQCLIIAVDFPARLFGHVLVAHHRNDIFNYSQTAWFVVAYGVLWFCFKHGFGVYSLLWANVAGWIASVAINGIACLSIDVLPAAGLWGKPSRNRFREIFRFGTDVFWIALGAQLITASQVIVVTRSMGLTAAASWAICTRTFTLANQIVWRPLDSSLPALSEMFVRREEMRFRNRFADLFAVTAAFSVLAALLFALCNQPFVTIWTNGKIRWPIANDVLLGIWLMISALVHSLCSVPLISKKVGAMRYVYVAEGLVVLIVGNLMARAFGFLGLIITSISASLVFSLSYGAWRAGRELHVPLPNILFGWLAAPMRLFVLVAPLATGLYFGMRSFSATAQLIVFSSTIALVGGALFLRYGIPQSVRKEFCQRAPIPLAVLIRRASNVVD